MRCLVNSFWLMNLATAKTTACLPARFPLAIASTRSALSAASLERSQGSIGLVEEMDEEDVCLANEAVGGGLADLLQ